MSVSIAAGFENLLNAYVAKPSGTRSVPYFVAAEKKFFAPQRT